MAIAETIKESLRKAAESLDIQLEEIHLEHPSELFRGDYSTNIAMVAAQKLGGKPTELADKIVEEFEKNKPEEVSEIEVAGPGFINFYLSRDFFIQSVEEVLDAGDDWGKNNLAEGYKVMVEYTDPNPFKVMHIGHLVPNAVGESISRLVEFSGAETKRANYQGDIGLHVAKTLWGMEADEAKVQQVLITNTSDEKPAVLLGQWYARGSRAYDEDPRARESIKEINILLYKILANENTGDPRQTLISNYYSVGRKVSLEAFEEIYKILGTKFDYYFFESDINALGKEKVEEGLEKGVFEKSDGAVVFQGDESKGLHTRVFITKEGLPTYEAKDFGLAYTKQQEFPFDLSITVTGNEQKEYFKVVKAALEELDPELAKKILIITNGFLRLEHGKMSSRTGDVVPAESLIDDATRIILKKIEDKTIAEEIAVAAIKYSILKQGVGKDIVFDFEKSLSFEGDSGPYLQYAHTRAQSVLAKGGSPKVENVPEEVTEVEKLLYQFPEVVERAQKEYEPHYVLHYLTELAGAFNSFYAREKFIGSEHESYYMALTKAFQLTMKNGLWLLGIKTPERM